MSAPVLLVLADARDPAAAAFVDRHRGAGVRRMVPADLSSPGWIYRVGDAAGSVAVVEGKRVPAARLRGVLTLLAGIDALQLPHVVEADRDYVAAEMNAFLVAWLGALPCPVWNRPVAPSLSGPGWRWEQWRSLAARLGLRVAPGRQVVTHEAPPAAPAAAGTRCSVVGHRVIGARTARRREAALRLAGAAKVDMLDLLFDSQADDAALVGVGLAPNVAEPSIGRAVIEGWC